MDRGQSRLNIIVFVCQHSRDACLVADDMLSGFPPVAAVCLHDAKE
jgi:hypothetical protein